MSTFRAGPSTFGWGDRLPVVGLGADELRGRSWEVGIHPFSFEEALRHQGYTILERPDFLSPRERSTLEQAFPVDPGLIPLFDRTGRANTGDALVLVSRRTRRTGEAAVTAPAEGAGR